MRGAERTFAAMADCWPDAPIHTLLFDDAGTLRRFSAREVHTSALQRLPVDQRSFRALLPLLPAAARSLRPETEVVVSSSSAFAHAVPPASGGVHICYCHSPLRYVWHERELALAEVPRSARLPLRAVLARVRAADLRAAARVDHFIANSNLTRSRIERFWRRESTVIHPPVDVERFLPGAPEDFFLTVGELTNHKRTDVALRAVRRAGRKAKVVGEGPARARLEAEFGDVAEFVGRVGDGVLADLLSRARAVIVPNVEEFGIVAVEAQAAGRPVVGVTEGGTVETVIDGQTGVLVPPGDVDAMAEALREVDFDRFRTRNLVDWAATFSRGAFQARLRRAVDELAGAPVSA
jgi:glycosyltransferase involved in cell wall biosynthesis